jgi:L-malate glycosyltransferase
VKKRVLQLIGSFHQGGSESQAVALTGLLKAEGSFDVSIATLNNEGVLRERIEASGLSKIPEFPLTSFYDTTFVHQVRRFAQFLRDNNIDIIHTHDFYTNIFGMAAAALARVPVRIASKRETMNMRSAAQNVTEKAAFASAKAITVNSEAVRRFLIGRSIPREKMHLIYNGIDLARFARINGDRKSICKKTGLPTEGKVHFVTMVANMRHAVKNIPMLLRAAKRIIRSRPEIHFVIAGEGELEQPLRCLSQDLGIAQNVNFIGRCDDIPALLSVSSVCVLTSTAEGFSNSLIEYMAAGKAVVATNVGGACEAIVEGKTGFLVKSDDDAEMCERLLELLNDDDKRARFCMEGKRVVAENFSSEVQLKRTIDLYNALLK